jgi:hypothetical protein
VESKVGFVRLHQQAILASGGVGAHGFGRGLAAVACWRTLPGLHLDLGGHSGRGVVGGRGGESDGGDLAGGGESRSAADAGVLVGLQQHLQVLRLLPQVLHLLRQLLVA